MRTFQFSDAKSHKFWSVAVDGATLTVAYGKVGTAGQTQTKAFPTPAKAAAEAEKLIREKTGKGYVETTPVAPTSDAEAIERTLADRPDDLSAWCAYADYLSERGDPRGEFMRVQIGLEDAALAARDRKKLAAEEQALLAAYAAEWLGPLAPFLLDPPKPRHEWRSAAIRYAFRRGWLADLEVPRLGVEFARVLNRCPQARFLSRLHVHTAAYEVPTGGPVPDYVDGTYGPGPDLPDHLDETAAAFHVLARFPHFGSVRVLHLGNPNTDAFDDADGNCHTNGEYAHHYLKQMPNAEEVYLLAHRVDAAKVFALPMPKLRVLQVSHNRQYPLDKLAANKTLTNLTTLLCHPHALEYDDEDEGAYIRLKHLRAVCRSPHLSALTNLRLRLADFGDDGVKEIVSSGILKRLTVLDLQSGRVTDAGAKALAACPDLKHLRFLNLRSNALTPAGAAALKATGVKFDAAGQHTQSAPAPWDEAPEYLFEGDIE